MESGGYPQGTEFDSNAPWNNNGLPDKEIEVTISLTLSKTTKIKVNDYKVIDENTLDFSRCSLVEAVESQVVLPQNLAEYVEGILNNDTSFKIIKAPKSLKDALRDCKDWSVDELEVIKDD